MFSGSLEALPQVCKSAWGGLERALILRRQPACRIERLLACVEVPEDHAHAPAVACASGATSLGEWDDEHIVERDEVARACQKTFDARRIAVVGGVELECVVPVVGARQQLDGRGEALAEQLLA